MRDFLVSILPDPGAVIFLVIAVIVFTGLFCMVTDKRQITDRVEHDTAPRPQAAADPEGDARRRGF